MMKITLKLDAKPVKQCPYRLNLKYKEKVREELDKILVAGIIEPVEESDWVSPMKVQEKKLKGEIRICVDTCQQHQIPLNLKKCTFLIPFGNLLGHVVCRQGLMVDPHEYCCHTQSRSAAKCQTTARHFGTHWLLSEVH